MKKKSLPKILAVFLSLLVAFSMIGVVGVFATACGPAPNPATGVAIVRPDNVAQTGVITLTLETNPTAAFTTMLVPEEADPATIVWSTNPATATTVTVSAGGIVTAHAPTAGSNVQVVARIYGSDPVIQAAVQIAVLPAPIPVSSITIDGTAPTLALNYNPTVSLTATVLPADATDRTVTWSSSDLAIATVNPAGLVTAHSAGYAVISATSANLNVQPATMLVTVQQVAVTGINIPATEAPAATDLIVSIPHLLTANIAPFNAYNRTVTWTSSNPAVVSVPENSTALTVNLMPVAPGTATITVTTTTEPTFTANIPVTVGNRTATAISTPEEFQNMSLTGIYYLANDINFVTEAFSPIGGGASASAQGAPFSGILHGRGHSVTGITATAGVAIDGEYYADPAADPDAPVVWMPYVFGMAAVFRATLGATIRQISFVNTTVYARGGIGGLLIGSVGADTVIENVFVSGTRGGFYYTTRGYWDNNAALFGNIGANVVMRNIVADVEVAGTEAVANPEYAGLTTAEGPRNIGGSIAGSSIAQNIFVIGDNITDFGPNRHFSGGGTGSIASGNLNAFLRNQIPTVNFLSLPAAIWYQPAANALPRLR